jgi:hypothetical protein
MSKHRKSDESRSNDSSLFAFARAELKIEAQN